MTVEIACERCGRPTSITAVIDGLHTCGRCWNLQGCPFPGFRETLAQRAAREAKIRDDMLKRGGADRHLVRKGST